MFMLLVGLLPSCGDNKTIPDGSTITIDPSSVTLTNISTDSTINFTLILRYSDGTPIPLGRFRISGAFAAPNASAAYQFYYFPTGPDNPNGNTAVPSGFEAQTDDNGVYKFSIVVFGSNVGFIDTIRADSGTASGTVDLTATVTATP